MKASLGITFLNTVNQLESTDRSINSRRLMVRLLIASAGADLRPGSHTRQGGREEEEEEEGRREGETL